MKDYYTNTFYSQEDEGYIADIPDLKHCSTFGEPVTEEGKPTPKLMYQPAIYQVAR